METTIKNPSARYSTREVAARLFLSETRTRHLLLAAGIPHSKFGASYAWDAAAVDRLVSVLQPVEERGR
jgi:hypothetical protein